MKKSQVKEALFKPLQKSDCHDRQQGIEIICRGELAQKEETMAWRQIDLIL
jgi:hypothetical protein